MAGQDLGGSGTRAHNPTQGAHPYTPFVRGGWGKGQLGAGRWEASRECVVLMVALPAWNEPRGRKGWNAWPTLTPTPFQWHSSVRPTLFRPLQGQNVNKVSTKVDMRFKIEAHDWLSDEVKNQMYRSLGVLIPSLPKFLATSCGMSASQVNQKSPHPSIIAGSD